MFGGYMKSKLYVDYNFKRVNLIFLIYFSVKNVIDFYLFVQNLKEYTSTTLLKFFWAFKSNNMKEYTSTTSVSANIADVIALNIW